MTHVRRSPGAVLGVVAVGALVVALSVPASASARPFGHSRSSASYVSEARLGASEGTCPTVPVTPKPSADYKVDGQTWNPADAINWTLDTKNIGSQTVPKRVTDIKRALADTTRVTGFKFVYKGNVTSEKSKPPPFLIQFGYVKTITGKYAGSLGKETNLYITGGSRAKQTIDGNITLLSSLQDHYGYYDAAHPTSSPEGDVLLHEVAAVIGLANVPLSPPEVMSSRASTSTYFLQYQAGDNYGLYKVGASQGCSGYLGIKR